MLAVNTEQLRNICNAISLFSGDGNAVSVELQTERRRGKDLDIPDPRADYLEDKGWVLGGDTKKLLVTCPWEDGHSTGTEADGSTVYFRAGSNGYQQGHFKCLHGSCAERTQTDFDEATGYAALDFVDFSYLDEAEPAPKVDKENEKGKRFRILSVEDLDQLPPMDWRIHGILPERGVVAWYGASGSAKSFSLLYAASCISAGGEFFGRLVKPGRVVYIAAEGEAGIPGRTKALRKMLGEDVLSDVGFIPEQLDLMSEYVTLADDLAEDGANVVILDTLNQLARIDENSSEQMGNAIAAAKHIARTIDGLVILVHHAGKDERRGMRGHSSLFAAMDAVIEVSNDGKLFYWKLTKAKEAELGARQAFRLETVELGVDRYGLPITSAAVVPEFNVWQPEEIQATPREKVALDALARLFTDRPAGVLSSDWEEAFIQLAEGKLESRKKSFRTCRRELLKKRLVRQDGELYLPDEDGRETDVRTCLGLDDEL